MREMKALLVLLNLAYYALCNADASLLTGEVLLLSEDANYLQSTTVSISRGSHPFSQLSSPELSSPATLSCSSCSSHWPNTLTSSDGRLLVLTDSHLQVFVAVAGNERSQFEWRQSLALDTGCSPLHIQLLSTGTNNLIVVCNTTSSIGYHIVIMSGELFQLHSLVVPDTDITDLIVGGFKPFLQPESDALVYIRDGELTFLSLFDSLPPVSLFIEDDTACSEGSVLRIFPLPKPTRGNFRFILDCQQEGSGETLRYKVTLSPMQPDYPESVHLLPTALVVGTPIASPDSEYFVVVQSTTIAVVRTEETGTYRVHTFQSEIRDVSFTGSAVPTLVIVSPGQNHMLLQLESFLTNYNTSVKELVGSQSFCPNQSRCLPHAVVDKLNLFLAFTATTTPDGATRYFNLNIYDLAFPSNPAVRIQNLAVYPSVVFPNNISLLLLTMTSTSLTAPAPSDTNTQSLLVSQSSPIPNEYHSTTQLSVYYSTRTIASSARNDVFTTAVQPTTTASEKSRKSSSSDTTQTPTLREKDRQYMSFQLSGVVIVVFCALVFVLLLVVVMTLFIIVIRRRQRKSTQVLHYTATYQDEEKCVSSANDSKPPSSVAISAINPTSVPGTDQIEVNTVSVAETRDGPVSRPSSGQLVTLDLKGSALTLPSSGSSSGVSSAAGSPSTSTRELHAEPEQY